MTERWYFTTESDAIELRARAEAGGVIGDGRERLTADSEITFPPGLTFDALREARNGVIEIAEDGKSFRIIGADSSDG